MSQYLGFDPALLATLRDAITRAVAELDRIRNDDPEARADMMTIQSARNALRDRWQPLIDAILQCRALRDYQPVGAGESNVMANSLGVQLSGRGWRMLTDPLVTPPAPLTGAQVRALATALESAGPRTIEETQWVTQQLRQIALDPAMVATFLAAMTPAAWANIANPLGDTRRALVSAAYDVDATVSVAEAKEWRHIDDLFAALGTVVDDSEVTKSMTAYAGALLAANLHLSAAPLATLARAIIEREQVEIANGEVTYRGDHAADIVIRAMLATPGAPAAFAVEVADQPALMAFSAASVNLTNELMVAATSPDTLTPKQAEIVVPALLAFIAEHAETGKYSGYNPGIAAVTADLIAPYLAQMTATFADSLPIDPADREAILMLIINSPQALDELTAHATADAATRAADIAVAADSDTLRGSLVELSTTMALVGSMLRSAAIIDAQRRQESIDQAWGFMSDVLGFVPLSTAGGIALGLSTTAIRKRLEASGLFTADVAGVQAASRVRFDFMTTLTAATLVTARFEHLVAEGRLDRNDPPPPQPDAVSITPGVDYSVAFERWLDDLDASDTVATELALIKQTILSAAHAEVNADVAMLGLS